VSRRLHNVACVPTWGKIYAQIRSDGPTANEWCFVLFFTVLDLTRAYETSQREIDPFSLDVAERTSWGSLRRRRYRQYYYVSVFRGQMTDADEWRVRETLQVRLSTYPLEYCYP